MKNLSLNELKLIDIKDYENKSEDDLIKILNELKTKISLSKKSIKKIREKCNELGDWFFKPEIREIRGYMYDIKTPKKIFLHQKLKRLKETFLN